MSYTKHTWIKGDVIDAAKLNNIENGIAAASEGGGGSSDYSNILNDVTFGERQTLVDTTEINFTFDEMWDGYTSVNPLSDVSAEDFQDWLPGLFVVTIDGTEYKMQGFTKNEKGVFYRYPFIDLSNVIIIGEDTEGGFNKSDPITIRLISTYDESNDSYNEENIIYLWDEELDPESPHTIKIEVIPFVVNNNINWAYSGKYLQNPLIRQGANDGTAFDGADSARGWFAHAEGSGTQSNGNASHAEGMLTFADASAAHTEGNTTYASGEASHAENVYTSASGYGSHVEGGGTVATPVDAFTHISGVNNKIPDEPSSPKVVSIGLFDAEDEKTISDLELGLYAEIVGNGTSNQNRSNARTLDWDGNAWYAGNITAAGGSLTIGSGTNAVTITAAQLAQLLALLSNGEPTIN